MPDPVGQSERALKPRLDAALMDLPGGIGNAIRLVRAAPVMAEFVRDIARGGEINELVPELREQAKVALDLLDGGDGVIYR